MMRCLRRSSTGQPERSSFVGRRRLTSANTSSSSLQRVVARHVAPVVDEVEADLALLVGDAVERHDACPACTMAESSPASTHSWRNTELSTWRAAGLSPNDTFDTPSVVYTPGISALMRRIASMVAMRVTAQVVVAGRERERQRVEDQVARVRARSGRRREVVDAVGDFASSTRRRAPGRPRR